MAYGSSLLLHRFFPACSISKPLDPPSHGTSSFPRLLRKRASSTLSATPKISASSLARDTHASTPVPTHNSSANGAQLLLQSVLPMQSKSEPSIFSDAKSLANSLRMGGLDASLVSYKENFVIRCYEVGMNRTASIETIANLLQEVACNHAQSVGFSTDGFATTPSMRKRHLIWVTTRMHIEVNEYPVWGDVVQIETWCQSEGKAGTRRDWLMTDVATGRLIGGATSTWVMMNQDTRRLSRITEDVRDELICYYPNPPRLAFPEENSWSLKKIPKLEEPAEHVRSGLMPRRGNLDMNQHVNNVTYIGWNLESIPQHLVSTHQLYSVTLDYRRECKYDDVVESLANLETCSSVESTEQQLSSLHVTTSNGTAVSSSKIAPSVSGFEFLHLLRLAGSNVEINRGRSVWKRKSERL